MSDLETAKLSAAPSVDSAVTPISSITMKVPSATIGNNSLPQISVGQVLAGDTVYLTTDALCSTTPIGSTTATSSGNLDISTLTPLVDGTYRIYAFRKNSENQTSACSSVYVDYILDTVAPDVSVASLNNLDHTISSTQTPLIEVLNATDVASGIDHYDLSIGTTMGGQDILAWSNVENSSILSKINIALDPLNTNWLKVRAVDVAGNISSTLVSSVLYKKSLPGSNGTVNDLNYDNAGKILYLAGDFSYLGHPTGSAVILDNSTGNGTLPRSPEQNINAAVNGKIYAVAPSSLGGYFIGGEFTSIGGISGFSNLAYVGVDGVPSDWKPSVNGPVESLMVSTLGSTPYLFVGGNYTSIMGTAKTNLSALSLSGLSKISSATLKPSALTSWNPAPNGEVLSIAFHNGYNILAFGGKFTQFQGAANNYFAMVDSNFLPIVHTISPNNFVRVLASGNTGFYLGGDFTSVSGSSRGYGALVSIASGMILTSWDPLANATIRSIYCWSSCIVGGDFSNIAGGARNAIAILGRNTASLDASFTSPLPSGSKVYSILDGVNWTVAGDFNDPTTRRRNIASLDNTTGAYIGGMNQPSASGPVYVVTNNSASSLNFIFIGGDFFSAGGVERSGLAAIDLNTYQVSSVFAPRITYTAGSGGGLMQNISRTGSRLFATGNFSTVNGLSRAAANNLIEFDTTSGTATSFEPTSSAGTISKTQIDGTTLYVLGSFMDIGGDNSHIGLAKYDISTATPALQAYTAGLFFGSTVTKVLPVAGNQLIIGGTFATIQGQLRYSLARVDASTGNLDTNFLSPVLSGTVFDIQLDTDNSFMWVTGSISFLGVPSSYDVGYVDVLTGSISPLNFSPSSPGGYVKQLIDLGSSIFIAGPFADVNSVATKGLAQVLKADTTVVTPFTSLNLNAGVNKVETDGSGFYFIGGSFSTSGSSNTPSSSLLFIDGAGHIMTGFPW